MEHSTSLRKCKFCGDEFVPYRPNQEFCSPEHRDTFYSRYIRGSCADAIRLLEEAMTKENEFEKKSREGGV